MKSKQNHRTASDASHRMLYPANENNQTIHGSPYPFEPNHQYQQAQWRGPWMGERGDIWMHGDHGQPQSGKESAAGGLVSTVEQPPHHFAAFPVDHPAFHHPSLQQPSHPHQQASAIMAMPGHSPSYNVPASPPRSFSGYPDPRDPPPMYGPHSRPMLPPSPQHFPRYSQPSLPGPSPAIAANNGPQHPPQKRPGSSMSISSMLGGEPERPIQDQYHNHGSHSRTPSRQASGSMSLGTVMSPPQYPTKPNAGEYSYKPRSKTPDRFAGVGTSFGARTHRSSSGTMTQRPGPFYESQPRQGSNQGPYPEPRFSPPFGPALPAKDEFEDRTRRTSISGILQRPESQPQPDTTSTFAPAHHPPTRPESIPPLFGQHDRPGQPHVNGTDVSRANGHVGSYDTRPPGIPRPPERPAPQSLSPELRRPLLNGNDGRPYGAFGHVSEAAIGTHNMMRQDSVQSQSDRSVLGDRLRNRPYSPFAGSVASQSGLLDDQVRKGSDELSQHRAILNLANESKRGRYSPLPQAVQGAQAQTPVPDTGIKTEQGRVFSGIGSGLGTTSANPTPTPQPPSASPFKQNEGGARLSEENLMKVSRSASGMSKRNRKAFDDEARAESDVGDAKKTATGRGKRSKYQHSYKLDLEEAALGQRKTTFGTSNHIRRTGTPTSNPSQLANHPLLHRQSSPAEKVSQFRPKKTIRISSVIAQARRSPRRHLGFYKYDPEVTPVDIAKPTTQKFDVSIRPNLLPAFTDAEHVNCTYTVRVPRMWLRHRERGLICAERYLWGSGIYTDDSDPVAAAMHSGFISSVHPAGIDEALLERVIEEQNPRIEGSPAPERPCLVEENRDLHITLLVLPQLESYVESARFGIKSRSWPDDSEPVTSSPDSNNTPHDGVSFMVLKTEFVDDGIEVKRVGRTGKEKRERLRREMMERKRALELEKENLARAAIRAKERKDAIRRKNLAKKSRLSAPEDSTTIGKNGAGTIEGDRAPKEAPEQENAPVVHSDKGMELDVGQSPGDWIRQLAVAAA